MGIEIRSGILQTIRIIGIAGGRFAHGVTVRYECRMDVVVITLGVSTTLPQFRLLESEEVIIFEVEIGMHFERSLGPSTIAQCSITYGTCIYIITRGRFQMRNRDNISIHAYLVRRGIQILIQIADLRQRCLGKHHKVALVRLSRDLQLYRIEGRGCHLQSRHMTSRKHSQADIGDIEVIGRAAGLHTGSEDQTVMRQIIITQCRFKMLERRAVAQCKRSRLYKGARIFRIRHRTDIDRCARCRTTAVGFGIKRHLKIHQISFQCRCYDITGVTRTGRIEIYRMIGLVTRSDGINLGIGRTAENPATGFCVAHFITHKVIIER